MADIRRDIRLGLDAREASQGLRQLSQQAERIGSSMTRTFKGVGVAVAGVGAGFGLLAGAAAAATRVGLGFAKAASEQVKQTSELALRLGLNVEKFSELAAVAKRFGATAEDVADSIKDLSARAVENEKEFTDLGISVRGAQGELLNGIPLYESVTRQIRAMKDETQQAVAMDILASDAFVRLGETVRMTEAEYAKFAERVRSTGEIIDDRAVAVTRRFDQALQDTEASFASMSMVIGQEIGAVLGPGLEELNRGMQEFTGYFSSTSGRAFLRDFFATIGEGFASLIEGVVGLIGVYRELQQLAGRVGIGSGVIDEPIGPDGLTSIQRALTLAGQIRGAMREAREDAIVVTESGGRSGRGRTAGGGGGSRTRDRGRGDGLQNLGNLGNTMEGPGLLGDLGLEMDPTLEAFNDAMAQISAVSAETSVKVANDWGGATTSLVGSFGSLASSLSALQRNLSEEGAQESEAFFRIQQGVQAAQAAINTGVAITRALSDLGPVAGPVAAVGIGLAGAAQVAAILSTSPGRPSVASGAAARVRTTAARPPRFGPGAVANDSREVTVNIYGSVNSRRTAREVRDALEATG